MESLKKKGFDVQPITIEGRKIAHTFWGAAWCDHLEAFSDFANRLPRGRTYVRNGSVCHLAIDKGKVEANVSGSELYDIKVSIETLSPKKWMSIKARCGGQIGSLIELLQGRLSDQVMEVVTDRKEGLYPLPGEIAMRCSCPDMAVMCKHVAAVLYGVGARLDSKPELLFLLRGVNHEELIEADAGAALKAATTRGKSKRLAPAAMGDVFGIELVPEETDTQVAEVPTAENETERTRRRRPRAKNASAKPEKSPRAAKKATKAT
jgi:uncharacterized Zn finger protein